MAIDRKKFFDGVRSGPFPGTLSPAQTGGMSAILDEWDRRKLTDLRWLAYMLATTYHETARTMQPINEYGKGKGRKYGVPDSKTGQTYYGRGFVQLTWLDNYRKMGAITGADLVNHPELALQLPVASAIMFEGMIRGTFTGKKLADYFSGAKDDPVNARRIINGTDKAETIAGYHKQFLSDLKAADTAQATAPAPLPVPPAIPATKKDAKEAGGVAGTVAVAAGGWWLAWGQNTAIIVLSLVALAALYWFIVRPILRRYWALDDIDAGLMTRLRLALKGMKTKLLSWLLGIAGVALPVLSFAGDVDLSKFLPDIGGIPASTYQYGILALIGWATNALRNATTTPVGQTDLGLIEPEPAVVTQSEPAASEPASEEKPEPGLKERVVARRKRVAKAAKKVRSKVRKKAA